MMNNLVTVRLGPKMHIMVPRNDLHPARSALPSPWKSIDLKSTPAVYIRVCRG